MTIGGVSRRRSLFIWGLFCMVTGGVFLSYLFASIAGGRGDLVMPLDDVYIHFQYARQFAAGQPYVYNSGQPPSSGATSFLYPYLLAVGYLLGFQGLNLGLWAMAIGALSLLGSMWLLYLLARVYNVSDWITVIVALVFALTGAVSWHFMNGMETGLMVCFTLLTLYALIKQSIRGSVFAASLLALIRPEGGILAALAVGVLYMQHWRVSPSIRFRAREMASLAVPIAAVGVQPLVNLLFTGSPIASGNAAKSLFGIVPLYYDVILSRIVDNFARMWVEFATSTSPREGLYLTYPIALLAVVGVVSLLSQPDRRWIGILVIAWLLAGTIAVATLDTAFWHFKRYQMPFMTLFFPLAAWGGIALWRLSGRPVIKRIFAVAIVGFVTVLTLWTGAEFLHHFALNVGYIYAQPLQMARWLDANTPPDAVVAVHDTGLIRYLGGRTTIDMVGLTTPGAAAHWRNGPGSVAEFLIQEQPDYIASYGHRHGLGLGMLADTSLYGEPLASFPVVLDNRYNVALAGEFQGIYEPDWTAADRANNVYQPSILNYLEGFLEVDAINLAELGSERQHGYEWINSQDLPGFPTEFHEFSCLHDACRVMDGGRRINGIEWFWLTVNPGRDLILVMRVHPESAGHIDISAADHHLDADGSRGSARSARGLYSFILATRWIPAIPGEWLEIATLIPAGYMKQNGLAINIVSDTSYSPYYVWAYQGTYQPETFSGQPLSTYQNGAIVLSTAEIDYQSATSHVAVNLDWYTPGNAQGDYIVFVHLYNDADEIVAQTDERPGNGTLPPGNWLPGTIHDTIDVDVSEVQPGRYQVAIGLYDPVTLERLAPTTGGDADNRLFIGEVDIHG